jgi:hypothetical protein
LDYQHLLMAGLAAEALAATCSHHIMVVAMVALEVMGSEAMDDLITILAQDPRYGEISAADGAGMVLAMATQI